MKKLISTLTIFIIMIILNLTVHAAPNEGHDTWESSHFTKNTSIEVMSNKRDVKTVSVSVTFAGFVEMLSETIANIGFELPESRSGNITRYEAMEILSHYITTTYEDEILIGRQKYMSDNEKEEIAQVQKINIERVMDFVIVYSCGIFSIDNCDGERSLTFGEATAICVRLAEYEALKNSDNRNEIDILYTNNCTCRLTGEHE